MNSSTFGHPEVKHPYADYKLSDAVALARQLSELALEPAETSLDGARNIVSRAVERAGHQWITGYCALDVLDAAIDGKDLRKNSRLIG